tara:strand:- start:2103 stop:3134 length:1032 start_codon:yes stop_codon:yes gene_type:complete
MDNILLRSPQYITQTNTTSGIASAELEIRINGTLRYTLVKPASSSVAVLFEYAELARDYLELELGSSGTPSTQATFLINLSLKFYDGLNATGSQVGSTFAVDKAGFDGYGTFYEEASPEMSTTQFPAISNYSQTVGGTKTYTMYAPKDVALTIPSILNNSVVYTNSSINATSMSINSITINIKRVDCTLYAQDVSYRGYTEVSQSGFRVYFINKYGAIQSEFFTLKAVRDISTKRETYNSNIISSTGTYSRNEHTKQNYNVNGIQSITLNSFYVPEYYSDVYSEMLLSEKVWVRYREKTTNAFINIPINIKDNNLIYKNSINDRLIQFEFSFDMSFDYINNIR